MINEVSAPKNPKYSGTRKSRFDEPAKDDMAKSSKVKKLFLESPAARSGLL
jgi:hypothetical protein